tara:strand:- start:18 stop:398 length:381 start_codon:yes stop_codon:yes gene_type:complete
MNYKSETPRTTLRYEADKYAQGAFSAYENMRDLAIELERELTAVTEQLTKAHETIGTMIDEIGMLQLKDKATTEQRNRLAAALKECREDSISLISFQRKEGYHKSIIVTEKHIKDATEALQSINPK